MKVTSRAVVGTDGTLRRLESAVPLTLRRVRADDPATCALRLVGTAAGPLAGDELTLWLTLDPGARADLAATGASIAQGRGGAASLRLHAQLGEHASLEADPGALIVCDGSHVDVDVHLELAAGSRMVWLETVVLGRSRDAGTGTTRLRWDVSRDGRPVLRQLVDLADPALRSWTGHVGRRRVLASALLTGPDVEARTLVADRHAVAQRIDECTVLVTVLSDDVHLALAARAELLNAFVPT